MTYKDRTVKNKASQSKATQGKTTQDKTTQGKGTQDETTNAEITRAITKHAIKNRLHHGKANEKAVFGRLISDIPGVRENIAEVTKEVNRIVLTLNIATEARLRLITV